MKVDDVLQCSFSSWYGLFSSLTFESVILPLSDNVLQYLTADGVFLNGEVYHGDEDHSAARSSTDGADGNISGEVPQSADFEREINRAIERLGGEVFPKLNWSSPKDAAWITPTHSLKCANSDDVFLLLKSSDFIVHDLTEPFLECTDSSANAPHIQYTLVLRKWADLQQSNEFRCFVKDGELVAVSQRHADLYFPSLAAGDYNQTQLTALLTSFFENNIRATFALKTYVFDAYVDGVGVALMDFNPWGIVTDSLLFTWDQLEAFGVKSDQASASTRRTPELRVVGDKTIRPVDPFAGLHGVPLEYHRLAVDVCASGKQPVDALMDLLLDQRLSDDEDMQ